MLPSNPASPACRRRAGIDSARVYSLPELIDLAESSNPLTRIAWNDARNVALAAGIAESTYLPKITASAVGAYQVDGTRKIPLPGAAPSGSGSATGTISAVSFQWLLFDFGERTAVIEAAKQASVISNIAFTAAHQQLIYDVSLAFYANAAARTRLTTATQSLENAQAVQAAAEDRRKHGFGTVDRGGAGAPGDGAGQPCARAGHGWRAGCLPAMINAMGISPLTKIKVADVSGRKLSPAMAASSRASFPTRWRVVPTC